MGSATVNSPRNTADQRDIRLHVARAWQATHREQHGLAEERHGCKYTLMLPFKQGNHVRIEHQIKRNEGC